MNEDVEKVLRAVARASKRTGRPIMAHSHPATRRGLEEMEIFADAMDGNNVWVRQTGGCTCLTHEPLARLWSVREVGRQHFDGNVAIQLRVVGAIDLTHPASAEGSEDPVMAEFVAFRQQHRRVQLSLADQIADYS